MTPPRRRVVVTGLGIVSAAGCTPPAFWSTLVSGHSVIRRIRRFDAATYPSQIGGEIGPFDLQDFGEWPASWSERGRITQYAAAAAACALDDAHLGSDRSWLDRTGVSIAAGMGSYDHEEVFGPCSAAYAASDEFDWTAFLDIQRIAAKRWGAERRTPGSIPALIANHLGLGGPVMSVMTACSGGTQAIGDAVRWIRSGRADAVVAGGSDSELYPMGLASFCLLGALSRQNDAPTTASRPFDGARDGFVLGEGAGMVVLEERDRAIRRGAKIYAEVGGFGSACDSFRVTDPHPDGTGGVLAMSRALADARVGVDEVDYINAHGTSTLLNDRIETLAIKRVFGQRAPRIAISSTKSMIGHATVAAGAIEAVATALTLVHQTIHPTINHEVADADCDLDYVPNQPRDASVEVALSNSFAFGGQSATLLLRRHHDR